MTIDPGLFDSTTTFELTDDEMVVMEELRQSQQATHHDTRRVRPCARYADEGDDSYGAGAAAAPRATSTPTASSPMKVCSYTRPRYIRIKLFLYSLTTTYPSRIPILTTPPI